MQVSNTDLGDQTPWGSGTFGDALLAPTIIYVQRLLSLIDIADVKVSLVTLMWACGSFSGYVDEYCL